MANTRELQSRMKSIKDTMKITSAMHMIASSNLQKAKKNLEETEPYFYTLQIMIAGILGHMQGGIEHQYFDERPEIKEADRKKGYIVVTADKGLAGGYNHNVIKLAQEFLDKPGHNELFVLGQLGRSYFEKKNVDVDTSFKYTVQKPTMHRARGIAEKMLDLFNRKELDEVHIIYTRMENAVEMVAETKQLLPLQSGAFCEVPAGIQLDEIPMLPTPKDVLDCIIPNYVTGFIYGSLVESFCSEQNSRMMAMDGATKSAKEILRNLNIEFNRVRQAAITQEITEVISGAKAQKKKKAK